MITEFGGAVAVPIAVRSSDSTTTMRVNDVIMIRIDGAIDSTVSSAISWIARSVTPPPPAPPRLMLMSCACAGIASDAAPVRTERKKTLRGRACSLTKTALDGRATRPSRLRDFQSWSFPGPALREGLMVPAARCGLHAGERPGAPARPEGRASRRRGGAAQLRAAAPSRRDSARRSMAPQERAPAAERAEPAAQAEEARRRARRALEAPSPARSGAADAASEGVRCAQRAAEQVRDAARARGAARSAPR